MLTDDQLAAYAETGFVRLPGFSDAATCEAMLDRVVAVATAQADGDRSTGWVMPEANLAGTEGRPEQRVSKIFRLHRDPVFHRWITSPAVTAIAASIVGPEVDCFLSQFIFKNPGAWGQPWHQDSFYFAFEPARPIVGLWLAVTEATLANGCLHVVPGANHPINDFLTVRPPAEVGM